MIISEINSHSREKLKDDANGPSHYIDCEYESFRTQISQIKKKCFYFPDNILKGIFSYANDLVVDSLKHEVPKWQSFQIKFLKAVERKRAECKMNIPSNIFSIYKLNMDHKRQYRGLKNILNGWTYLSAKSPWKMKANKLNMEFYIDQMPKIIGQHLYYIDNDFTFKATDIFTVESINTFARFPDVSYFRDKYIVVYQYSKENLSLTPYICFYFEKTLHWKKHDEENDRNIFKISKWCGKLININHLIFLSSQYIIKVFRITQEGELLQEPDITFDEIIIDIEAKEDDLIILTTNSYIIWNNFKEKELYHLKFISGVISCGFYRLMCYRDDILIHDIHNKLHKLIFLRDNTVLIRKLADDIYFFEAKQFISSDHVLTRNQMGELELEKPLYSMSDLMKDKRKVYDSSNIKNGIIREGNLYYINDELYLLPYINKRTKIYNFSK